MVLPTGDVSGAGLDVLEDVVFGEEEILCLSGANIKLDPLAPWLTIARAIPRR